MLLNPFLRRPFLRRQVLRGLVLRGLDLLKSLACPPGSWCVTGAAGRG